MGKYNNLIGRSNVNSTISETFKIINSIVTNSKLYFGLGLAILVSKLTFATERSKWPLVYAPQESPHENCHA